MSTDLILHACISQNIRKQCSGHGLRRMVFISLFLQTFFYSLISRLLKKVVTNLAQHSVRFVQATLLDNRFALKQRHHCVAKCATACAWCSLAAALCTSLILLYVWLLSRFLQRVCFLFVWSSDWQLCPFVIWCICHTIFTHHKYIHLVYQY